MASLCSTPIWTGLCNLVGLANGLHQWRVPQFALKYPCNPPPPPGRPSLGDRLPPPPPRRPSRANPRVCKGAGRVPNGVSNEHSCLDQFFFRLSLTAGHRGGKGHMVDGRDNAWGSRAPGPHARGNTARQVMDGLWTEAHGRQKQFRLVVVFLRGPGQSPVFSFASHVVWDRCFLLAGAAGALAGFVSAFAEPSGWCAGAVLDVTWCVVCASAAPSSWRIEVVLVVAGVI